MRNGDKARQMNSGMKNQTLMQDNTSHRALTDTYLVSKLRKLNEKYNYKPAYSISQSFLQIFAKKVRKIAIFIT